MGGNADIEVIRDFVRRNLAVKADGTPPEDVYFRIDAGASKRKAKQVAASVYSSTHAHDIEAVVEQVSRRLSGARAEHAHVFVRAVPVSAKHPAESLSFEGDPTDPGSDEPEEDYPKGQHAMAEALARVVVVQDRHNRDLVDRLERAHLDKLDLVSQQSAYAGYALAQDESGNRAQMAEAIRTLGVAVGPALAASMPAILGAILGRTVPPPPEPLPDAEVAPMETGERIRADVDDIVAKVDDIMEAAKSDPVGATAALPELARLRELVVKLAPLVGVPLAEPAAEPVP